MRRGDLVFIVELILLGVAGPILYFPGRFPPPLLGVALGLLGATWLWRRYQLGAWRYATPVDGAIFFLFVVMLPVALWAAPQGLRLEYSWPKAYVLLWNFCLFYTITTHARRHAHLLYLASGGFVAVGMFIALLAPLGTNWLFKLPGSQAILSRMPSVLADLSREGESGFHPNMIAGGLLYVLPFLMVLTWTLYRRLAAGGEIRKYLMWGALLSTIYMGGVFGLLQSRGGLVGLAFSVVVVTLMHAHWGRQTLVWGTLAGAIILPFVYQEFIELISDTPTVAAVGGLGSLEGFRTILWQHALRAIQDYPFTGSGLGLFQPVVTFLYPVEISPTYYFGHAHNFWLQAAVDFGLPGLAAILFIFGGGGFVAYRTWRDTTDPLTRGLALGFLGSLAAHAVYGLTDSVALGSTPNLLFWYLFALIFATGNMQTEKQGAAKPDPGAAAAVSSVSQISSV